MINKIANRKYNIIEFPHFVPEKELEYNIDFASRIVKGDWEQINDKRTL